MIPRRGEIEHLYEKPELDILDTFRPLLDRLPVADRPTAGRALMRRLWPDELEFISKTHLITTKNAGEVKLLVPNYAQLKFYKDVIVERRKAKLPMRAIILKARQLGFSTFIQAWQFEQCDREPHRISLTVSYDDPSTEELFQKARFIHNNSWWPRAARRDRSNTLEFEDNGSMFYTRTSGNTSAGRGITVHHLHCSEIPMWADAGETLTGLLQCVPTKAGTSILFESTARGATGEFYDAWKAAEQGRSDFHPFFAPWFWDPEYSLGFTSTDASNAFGRSLDLAERKLQEHHSLTLEQLHWRRYKIRNELQGSELKFRQEFPSTAQEAFLTSGAPVFNPDFVADLERNATAPLWLGNIHMELTS